MYGTGKDDRSELDELKREVADLERQIKEASAVQKVESAIAELKTQLSAAGGTPSKAHIALVTAVGKKFVIPMCDKPSAPAFWGGNKGQKDFRGAGKCQVCQVMVKDANYGLQCCNGGHWVCWGCMAKDIDWKKAMAEQPELFETEATTASEQID